MTGAFCVAYLSFSDFEAQITKYKANMDTDMIALAVVAPDHPGQKISHALNKFRSLDTKPIEIDMSRHIPKQEPKEPELSKFSFLPYVAAHWLWHTLDFEMHSVNYDHIGNIAERRHRLFLWKKLPFDFRP